MFCKSISCLLCLILLFPLFSGCSTPNDTLTADEITLQLTDHIEKTNVYIPCSERYLSSSFQMKSPLPEHACVRDPDHTIDELGVFACANQAEAVALKNSLNAGLEKRRKSFDDRYFSEEKEKLDSAAAVSCGRYVLYTVLDPELQSLVTKQFYHILKGNTLSNGTQARYQGQTNAHG